MDVVSDDAPGSYPVPSEHGVATRDWDGHVWGDDIRPAPGEAELPAYHRRPLHFLHSPGWQLLAVYVVSIGLGLVIHGSDPHATRPSGVLWLLPVVVALGTAAPVLGFIVLVQRRVRFDRVDDLRAVVMWGIVAGLVGTAFATGTQEAIKSVVSDTKDFWWVAGPTEEVGKALVPVVLWFLGRFRVPRQGLLLMLCSGATFGVLEAAQHALGSGSDGLLFLPDPGEFQHALLCGIVGAVAWRAAWRRPSWFTGPGMCALLFVIVVHGLNDQLGELAKPLAAVGMALWILYYLVFKHFAHELVPPSMVARVAPWWRPSGRVPVREGVTAAGRLA